MSFNKLALIVGSFVISSSAFAETTATVELGGQVTSTLVLASATATAADELDLMNGRQIVKVADLTMTTNNEQGLTLTASSGALTKLNGTAIPYQVTTVVGGAAADASEFLVASGALYSLNTFGAGNFGKDLYIMYTPAEFQDPGYYGSTINLSVSDN
jgi:hypothetical protein